MRRDLALSFSSMSVMMSPEICLKSTCSVKGFVYSVEGLTLCFFGLDVRCSNLLLTGVLFLKY